MAQTKGLSLQCALKFIREHYGEENLNKIIGYMNLEEREVFQNETKIKAMKWYPHNLLKHLLEISDKTLGQGDYSLCEKVGAFEAEETFNGIFRVFLAVGNPHFLIRQGPLAWKTLNSSSDFELVELQNNHTIARIHNFDEPHKAHCHQLAGYFKRLLEMSGGENVQVKESRCRCFNDPYCEYEVTWE